MVGVELMLTHLFTRSRARVLVVRACKNLMIVMRVMMVCAICF